MPGVDARSEYISSSRCVTQVCIDTPNGQIKAVTLFNEARLIAENPQVEHSSCKIHREMFVFKEFERRLQQDVPRSATFGKLHSIVNRSGVFTSLQQSGERKLVIEQDSDTRWLSKWKPARDIGKMADGLDALVIQFPEHIVSKA
jgi:hypothetical protein